MTWCLSLERAVLPCSLMLQCCQCNAAQIAALTQNYRGPNESVCGRLKKYIKIKKNINPNYKFEFKKKNIDLFWPALAITYDSGILFLLTNWLNMCQFMRKHHGTQFPESKQNRQVVWLMWKGYNSPTETNQTMCYIESQPAQPAVIMFIQLNLTTVHTPGFSVPHGRHTNCPPPCRYSGSAPRVCCVFCLRG